MITTQQTHLLSDFWMISEVQPVAVQGSLSYSYQFPVMSDCLVCLHLDNRQKCKVPGAKSSLFKVLALITNLFSTMWFSVEWFSLVSSGFTKSHVWLFEGNSLKAT